MPVSEDNELPTMAMALLCLPVEMFKILMQLYGNRDGGDVAQDPVREQVPGPVRQRQDGQRKVQRCWVRPWIRNREESCYYTLLAKLFEDD